MALQGNIYMDLPATLKARQKTYLDQILCELGGRRELAGDSAVSLLVLILLGLLLHRQGLGPLGGLGLGPLHLDGRDPLGPRHLNGRDLVCLDHYVCHPFVTGRVLHLHVLESRGDPIASLLFLLLLLLLLLLAASTRFSPDSPAARSVVRHHWSRPRWTTPPPSSWHH